MTLGRILCHLGLHRPRLASSYPDQSLNAVTAVRKQTFVCRRRCGWVRRRFIAS